MYCPQCAAPLPEDAAFCPECGSKLKDLSAEAKLLPPDTEIHAAPGGYQWVYDYSLWRNPGILLTTWKVLLAASLFVAIILFLSSLNEGALEALLLTGKVFAITAGIMTALLALAYPLYSLINGGRYSVVFEMDEEGILHRQIQPQFERNQVLAMLSAALGAATGSPQAAGAGILAATKSSQRSQFRKVSKITLKAARHTIHLTDSNGFNEVYTSPQDFPFVSRYIMEHCPKARIKQA